MTRLSVNLNKVALIRNSRGSNFPNLVQVAKDCESYGAQGITIHPRPDQRHAKYSDILELKENISTELNIEGNPTPKFCNLVLKHKPHQVTLVPDQPGALTSDAGWDTIEYAGFLTDIIADFKSNGIRTSIFLDPNLKMVEGARKVGTDRIEFYTGPYAKNFLDNPERAIKDYHKAACVADSLELGINAGHDLDLKNLSYFCKMIPNILEVSIGHALISNALYFGLEKTIQLYLNSCNSSK